MIKIRPTMEDTYKATVEIAEIEVNKALTEIAKKGLNNLNPESFLEELKSHGIESSAFFIYMHIKPVNETDFRLRQEYLELACKLKFHERHKGKKRYMKLLKSGNLPEVTRKDEPISLDCATAIPSEDERELEDILEDLEVTLGEAEVMFGDNGNAGSIEPIEKTPEKIPKKRGKKPGKSNCNPVVTQIGSLPFDSVEKAVEYSLKHDIPFLPELPELGDSMFEYIKEPGQLSCLKEFAKHKFKKVKIQCLGPATLLMQKDYDEKEDLWRPEAHIYSILKKINAKEIILFLDEPSLGGASPKYKEWWHNLFNNIEFIMEDIGKGDVKLKKGVHVCNIMNWTTLFYNKDIDIISFDASQFGEGFISQGYEEFRERGGKVAWGIKRLEDIPRLDKNDSETAFRKGDLITATCGLGGMNLETGKDYTEKECENYLKMMREARVKIQNGTYKDR